MRKELNDIVLCIDFDKTINNADGIFPEPGTIKEGAKEYINKLWEEGYFIIIWSCRGGINQLEAEIWMNNHGILFDKFNQSRPNELFQFNNIDTRKVWATAYIDDASLEWHINGMPKWFEIYNMVHKLKARKCIPDEQLAK